MSDFRSSYRWKALRKHVIASSNGICGICGDRVDLRLSGNARRGPTVDHIVAVADGGPIWATSNMQLACRECNEAKERDTRKRLRDAAAGRPVEPFVSATAPLAVAPPPPHPFDPANPSNTSREWFEGAFRATRAAWHRTPPPFLTQVDRDALAAYILEHDT